MSASYNVIIPDRPSLRAIASGYGITDSGFSRMRFPEIREEIVATLQTKTGLLFETRPDSITGEFIDTFAEREAALWELSEAVYHAMYPCSAFGTNLDHAVSFAGVVRLFARQSTVLCTLYGVEGTAIPAGTTVKENLTRMNLTLDTDVTITQNAATDVTISIDLVVPGANYTVQINGTNYTYVALITDDAIGIANGLSQALLPSGLLIDPDANLIRLFVFENIPFAILILTANISLTKLGSPGNYTATDYGPLRLPIHSVTVIVSTYNGFESLDNLAPGQEGRDDETDDELRRRYQTGVFRLGAATLPAIYANLLQNVPRILALIVYENVQDVPDADGRDPHCIEVVCWGGDAQVIANQIWLLKAGGISTFGTTIVTIEDSAGYPHDIHFNRPFPIFIWLNIVVTLYGEETFPPDGVEQIQMVAADTGNLLGIDVDVILQRFMGPIYRIVSGIQQLDITAFGTNDPAYIPVPGDYVNATIPVGPRELSRFEEYRIAVTVL